MLWGCAPREIGRSTNHHEPDIASNRDRDHVAVDHFTQPNPGVVTGGHDVDGIVAQEKIDLDVPVSGKETGEQRRAQHTASGSRYVQSERATRFTAELTRCRCSCAQLVECRTRCGVQLLSCFSETNTARRPLNERNAEAFFQPPKRLAYGRTTDVEALAGGAESFRLRHRHEHHHSIQVVRHCEGQLISLTTIVK